MIIGGGSRSNYRWFSKHLMNGRDNERVRLAEIRGLPADNLVDAFEEMRLMARASPQCTNFFYHADLNTRADERLSEKEWDQAVDILEESLGLDGQPRVVIEHDKNGRVHRHVIWSRIDPDTLRAISDSHNYDVHMRTADQLERAFGHEPTPRGRGPDGPNPQNWEVFRGHESGIDPYDVKAELTALWRQADNGQAFAAALAEHGYILAKGDRRDFVVVDQSGDDHSLARRISGAKAKDIRARMADVDRDALPSVQAARELARERKDGAGDAPSPEASHHAHKHDSSTLFAEVAEELLHAVKEQRKHAKENSPDPTEEVPNAPSPFERVAQELAQAAHDAPAAAAAPPNLTEFERVASEAKAALRSAGGEDFMFAAGLAWMARKLGRPVAEPPPDRERTPFDRVVEETKQAIRANGGEPYSPHGDSFWKRSVAMLSAAVERAAGWVREAAQTFVGRLFQERNSDHDDPGMER